jgi:GNAT superfamily N-acetyltransferase
VSGVKALTGLAALIAAAQSDDSEASVASLAKRGLEVVAGNNDGFFSVRPSVNGLGNEVAYAKMGSNIDGGLSARDMFVDPEHRGNGLMNEFYDALEEITGKRVSPSNHLTPDGAKFWRKRDPDVLDSLLKAGYFDEWDVSGTVREALEGSLFGPPDPSKTVGF